MALDFAAGCIGGCAAIVAGHPLDTLKVQMQTGGGGAIQRMRGIVRQGPAGMYRGVGAPLTGVSGVNALVFGTYGNTRRSLPNQDSLTAHATAGAVSGIVQSFACAPVELVKTRQQLGMSLPSGAWAGARYILKTSGLRGLYRGLGVTMARDAPGLAVYFAAYEWLAGGQTGAMRVFCAGGLAGALSWVACYPMDVVKSRLQADAAGKYSGAWQCAARAVKAEGWCVLGRGLSAVLLRAFLANGACFTAVSWTEQAWQHAATFEPIPLVQVTTTDIPDLRAEFY